MRGFLRLVLLVSGVMVVATGVHREIHIMQMVGGAFLGLYASLTEKRP